MIYLLLQRVAAFVLFVCFLPLLGILCVLVRLDSKGPFLFRHKRLGKDYNPFWIYKIRTMVDGADKLQSRLRKQNEADGPVFKIRNDPRYTMIGKFLSHSALDELPQLINIIKGEMAFIGPRPLPQREAVQVPKKYQIRFSVLPGMTSSWIISGAHKLTFKKWMELDCAYVRHKSLYQDMVILMQTASIVLREIFNKLRKK